MKKVQDFSLNLGNSAKYTYNYSRKLVGNHVVRLSNSASVLGWHWWSNLLKIWNPRKHNVSNSTASDVGPSERNPVRKRVFRSIKRGECFMRCCQIFPFRSDKFSFWRPTRADIIVKQTRRHAVGGVGNGNAAAAAGDRTSCDLRCWLIATDATWHDCWQRPPQAASSGSR